MPTNATTPRPRTALPVLMLLVASCSGGISDTTTAAPSTSTSTTIAATTTSTTTASTTTTTTIAPDVVPRFESGDCLVEPGLGFRHHCGTLVVAEDRTDPEGAIVELPVVVFEGWGYETLPDPVIYLAGGGGADQLGMIDWYADMVERVVRSGRDFVMYNQRGSPRTNPELACPVEATLWTLAAEHPAIEERNRQLTEMWRECREKLVAQGIDLSQYTSAANAADADDLRAALGYEQANYYGTSYGTRIGLALLRDRPEGVRSIILDSTYPPEAPYYRDYAANVAAALGWVFEECIDGPYCPEEGLEVRFRQAFEQLEAEPVTLTYEDGSVVVDGMMFLDVIWAVVQSTAGRGAAPQFITEAADGDLERFRPVYPALFDYPGNLGVYNSFQCREEVPKYTLEEVAAAAEDLPAPIRDFGVQWFAAADYAMCEVWDVPVAPPEETAPVTSDVPALVVAGSVDPITPAAWGSAAAERLTNGWFLEFTGEAHGVLRSNDCARTVAMAFIQDPAAEPSAFCLERYR